MGRFDLNGRVALVTGGSRGIGRATAEALAQAGARVAISARKLPELEEVAHGIEAAGGRALPIACHVGNDEDVRNYVATATRELGPVSIVINNAGTNPHFGALVDIERAAWDKVFEVNVWSALSVTRAALDAGMRESGGSVVNMASMGGLKPMPPISAYSITKAALIHMTRALAVELAPFKVRVNAICPAVIRTRFASILVETDEIAKRVLATTPLGRFGEPDDVAGACVFLASDAAAYITGIALPIDGGALA
ncbi:MAG: SDR family oxidoreductase [Candidatus Dormibacteria bacterium]